MSATSEPNDREEYANMEWTPAEIMRHFGVDEVTAREFLQTHEEEIQDELFQTGWNLIDRLWEREGWAAPTIRLDAFRQRAIVTTLLNG